MTGLDPLALVRQEFEVKLKHFGTEVTEVLEQIHVSLEGITKGSRMAFDVVRMELAELKQRIATLEQIVADITKVPPQNADIGNTVVADSSPTSQPGDVPNV